MSIRESIGKNYILTLGVICLALLNSCAFDYKSRGDELADRLNKQIQAGEFEQIYSELSNDAKRSTPKDEFMRDVNLVVASMKEFDESLSWKKGNLILSNEYSDLYFVHRELERNGKKLDITITFTYSPGYLNYYDLCVMPSESSTGAICVTNALRKI